MPFGLSRAATIFRDSTRVPLLTHCWWQLPGKTKTCRASAGRFRGCPDAIRLGTAGSLPSAGCSRGALGGESGETIAGKATSRKVAGASKRSPAFAGEEPVAGGATRGDPRG